MSDPQVFFIVAGVVVLGFNASVTFYYVASEWLDYRLDTVRIHRGLYDSENKEDDDSENGPGEVPATLRMPDPVLFPDSHSLQKFRFCPNCGESADNRVHSAAWRWLGAEWAHKCGDPQAGHFTAVPRYAEAHVHGEEGIVFPLEEIGAHLAGLSQDHEPETRITIVLLGMTPEEYKQLPEADI